MKMKRFQVIEQNAKFKHVNKASRNTRARPIVLVLKMIFVKFWDSEMVFIFHKNEAYLSYEAKCKGREFNFFDSPF